MNLKSKKLFSVMLVLQLYTFLFFIKKFTSGQTQLFLKRYTGKGSLITAAEEKLLEICQRYTIDKHLKYKSGYP